MSVCACFLFVSCSHLQRSMRKRHLQTDCCTYTAGTLTGFLLMICTELLCFFSCVFMRACVHACVLGRGEGRISCWSFMNPWHLWGWSPYRHCEFIYAFVMQCHCSNHLWECVCVCVWEREREICFCLGRQCIWSFATVGRIQKNYNN